MDAETINCELDKQVEYTVSLLAEGCHHAKLEAAILELVAWFDLWREASGLPESGMWRASSTSAPGTSSE